MFLVRPDAPVVLWLGHPKSSLRTKLITYLVANDIVLILFFFEEFLWQWLKLNSSLTIASVIFQPNINRQEFIIRCQSNSSICSILVYCESTDLKILGRLLRKYSKVDGIYDDDTRLLMKLTIDLTFLSEELGDQQRKDNNEIVAQRHYDRALKLCTLVKEI